MRTTSRLLFILVVFVFISQVHTVGAVPVQTGAAVAATVTSADQVKSFLKNLQEAVEIDNRHRVATMFEFPMQAWVAGRTVTIRNASEFQSRYRQILDESVRQSIVAAKTQDVSTSAQGVMLDKGRIVCRPVGSKGTLRIVAINEPGPGR
jgi:hypothetical protein